MSPKSLVLLPLAALLLAPLGAAAPPVTGTAPVLLTTPGQEGSVLLGVWKEGRWLNVPGSVPLVKADSAYRTQGLSGPSLSAVGGAPVSYDGPCPDYFEVTLAPKRVPTSSQLATRADLNARPRPVTVLPTQNPVYAEVVRAELRRRGLNNPAVQLRQVIRADLDGNGSDEIVIEATHFAERASGEPIPPVNAQVGDYSLLLLRWVAQGQVRTTVLGADVVLKSGTLDAPRNALRERLEGLADLNGDGRMELVTSESYYEGDTFDAFTWTPAGGPKKVLETGCGE
ncbi:hypothetical protein [Deinococcus sp.]|uniref:hypothetical protein n=1 Tax=Deinococcus sp. TaxID=47478 RepID=UPI003CC67586